MGIAIAVSAVSPVSILMDREMQRGCLFNVSGRHVTNGTWETEEKRKKRKEKLH